MLGTTLRLWCSSCSLDHDNRTTRGWLRRPSLGAQLTSMSLLGPVDSPYRQDEGSRVVSRVQTSELEKLKAETLKAFRSTAFQQRKFGRAWVGLCLESFLPGKQSDR